MHTFDIAFIGTGQNGVPFAIDTAAAHAARRARRRARRAGELGVYAEMRVDFSVVLERSCNGCGVGTVRLKSNHAA